jgi:hypothetical protein
MRDPKSFPRDSINFIAINSSALFILPALLRRWLPAGRIVGGEYVALNPTRHDKNPGSFKVRLTGNRAGAWADFATNERGGDIISLAAYVHGLSQVEAAKLLLQMMGGRHG